MANTCNTKCLTSIFCSMMLIYAMMMLLFLSTHVESSVIDQGSPWAVLAPFSPANGASASALIQETLNFGYLLFLIACGYFPLRWTRNYIENMDYFGSNFH